MGRRKGVGYSFASQVAWLPAFPAWSLPGNAEQGFLMQPLDSVHTKPQGERHAGTQSVPVRRVEVIRDA